MRVAQTVDRVGVGQQIRLFRSIVWVRCTRGNGVACLTSCALHPGNRRITPSLIAYPTPGGCQDYPLAPTANKPQTGDGVSPRARAFGR